MFKLTQQQLLDCFGKMYLIRVFEYWVHRMSSKDHQLSSFIQLSVGQEAVAVGVCSALKENDCLALTYRSHAALLARGAESKYLLAEILGRRGGYHGGYASGYNIAIPSIGIYYTTAIVGANLPVAAGMALTSTIDHLSDVVVCFTGDGAVSEGYFHETMNIAALWSLPMIIVCENNNYAVRTPFHAYSPIVSVADRGRAYNIPSFSIDGNDVQEVYEIACQAVQRARQGKGPTLIECKTALILGHNVNHSSVEEEEVFLRQPLSASDPVFRLRSALCDIGLENNINVIEEEARIVVKDAIGFALSSPPSSIVEFPGFGSKYS